MVKTYKVLVADDNPQIVELLTFELVDFLENVQVTTASDGLRALDLANNFPFDLIISDNVMPGMEGIELFKLLRQEAKLNGETPFILCSGNFRVNEVQGIKNCKVIKKPYDSDRLQQYIKEQLGLT